MSPLSKRGHVRALQRVPRFARYHPPRTYLGKTAHRAVATFASMSLMSSGALHRGSEGIREQAADATLTEVWRNCTASE